MWIYNLVKIVTLKLLRRREGEREPVDHFYINIMIFMIFLFYHLASKVLQNYASMYFLYVSVSP